MPIPETFSTDYVPNTGSWDITIDNPTPSTTNETVTARALSPGETTVVLGTVSGAAAGVQLVISCNSDDISVGITWEIQARSPLEELIPNDTDGHYYIRRRRS